MPSANFTGNSLRDALHTLLNLQDRFTASQIDARECGTNADRRIRQGCEEALNNAVDAFRRAFDVEALGKAAYVVEYKHNGLATTVRRVIVRAMHDAAVHNEFHAQTGIDPAHVVSFRVATDEDLEDS